MSCPCRALCFTPKAGCPSVAARALEGPLPRAMSVARTIHQMPLFAGLEPDMLQRLMADVALVRQPAGTLLFSDGTDADCFYVVLSGQVKLFALLPDGRESVIEVIGAVSSFGEAAMLAGTGFPVNAEILEDSELLRVGRRAFVATLRSDHALAYRMLSALCGWQQRLTGEARLLRGQQAWLRVAAYLLSFTAGRSGRADIRRQDSGSRAFCLGLANQHESARKIDIGPFERQRLAALRRSRAVRLSDDHQHRTGRSGQDRVAQVRIA